MECAGHPGEPAAKLLARGTLGFRTLQDQAPSDGRHSMTFYANGLPIGTCFYELRVNEYWEMRKMTLLK